MKQKKIKSFLRDEIYRLDPDIDEMSLPFLSAIILRQKKVVTHVSPEDGAKTRRYLSFPPEKWESNGFWRAAKRVQSRVQWEVERLLKGKLTVRPSGNDNLAGKIRLGLILSKLFSREGPNVSVGRILLHVWVVVIVDLRFWNKVSSYWRQCLKQSSEVNHVFSLQNGTIKGWE